MSSDHRRLNILKSVRGLFSKKGLSVTSKELSAAAGVSEALIFKLFNNKEGVYKALLEMTCDAHQPFGNELTEMESSTEVLVFATYLLIFIKVCGLEPGETEMSLTPEELRGLILQSYQTDGEFARSLFEQGLGPWVPYFKECMEAAEKNGDLTPTGIPFETAIWMTHHCVAGVKMSFFPTPNAFMAETPDEETLMNYLLNFCLRAMGVHQKAINKIIKSKEFKTFKTKLENNKEKSK